jgi:energy-coupling factor transporter ATP-binding protein EcfA2
MNEIEESLICPYTGLRSFTEEESLYFKGRDEQINRVAALLERNKFLMLTGASGEGKSSLIYAGLVPNARAGFFKARYTNWLVASFRPERTPLKNMASAIGETFDIPQQTVATELERGYSSLIDLYTNSAYYIDENDTAWMEFSEGERKSKARSAANLLIIIDQFEELFTNPENYFNETPSLGSQAVVNLALETARIALQRNLPVYIVCTMRSDYIGQCSAFRGLPEYIGFSQFFVPRLKRQEVKQVIEEPAVLSGNRITKRLVERLVYDLADGIDQLPILQHALRQVWLAADHGRDEMDLIHYAMVGGMSSGELPDADKPRFTDWYSNLPAYQKKFYEEPGLNRVIEIHASRLYDGAWEYYNEKHPGQPITQKDAKRIVALAFACLTKIDDSRAVRNRMSLAEISAIINRPDLTVDVVGGVLDIFRESNNSFLRPYKTQDTEEALSADSVLDITHESLIRNWALLNAWAAREFEYYSAYLDFRKQLSRWKEHGKSDAFLLPLGPLTYFEEWYSKARPNAAWINRYAERKGDVASTLKESEEALLDTREFMKRSARVVQVTRMFMKYGAARIAVTVALAAIVLLTGFYWYDADKKTNKSIERVVIDRAAALLKSNEVGNVNKAVHLLIGERMKKGTLIPYVLQVSNKSDQVDLALGAYKLMLQYDKFNRTPLKTELIGLLTTLLQEFPASGKDLDRTAFLLARQNLFLSVLVYDEYFNPSAHLLNEVIPSIARLQHSLVLTLFRNPVPFKPTVPTDLNFGIQYWLTFTNPPAEEIRGLASLISPFGDSSARRAFGHFYSKDRSELNGRTTSPNGGGYQTLASLSAAGGDANDVVRCMEQLPESYFRTTMFNNYTNVLGYFHQYGHREEGKVVMRWIADHYPTDDPLTVYRNMVIRSGHMTTLFGTNFERFYHRSHSGYLHPNLAFAKREQFFEIAGEYEQFVKAVKNPDDRHFLLAMHYKRVAVLYHKYLTDRKLPVDQDQLDSLLAKAWDHYRQVNSAHLEGTIPITYRYYSDGIRNQTLPRRHVFLYPDYRDGWFASRFNTDLFINYILRNDLLSQHYTTPEAMNLIHEWLSVAHEVYPLRRMGQASGSFMHEFQLSDQTIEAVLNFVKTSPAGGTFDTNLALLILTNRRFERGEVDEARALYSQIRKNMLIQSMDQYEYLNSAYFYNALGDLMEHLAKTGDSKEAMDLFGIFKFPGLKTYLALGVSNALYNSYDPNAFVFLDSAYASLNRMDFNNDLFEPRPFFAYTLGRIGGERLNEMSRDLVRDIFEVQQSQTIYSLILGIATDGNYYTALQAMPSTLTEDQEMICYNLILLQVARDKVAEPEWKGMDDVIFWPFTYYFTVD